MWVQLGNNPVSGNRIAACGLVDGSLMGEPLCPYSGEAPADGNYLVTTMAQSMDNVAPGHHTLQTQVYTDLGATIAQYHVVYRLYKP